MSSSDVDCAIDAGDGVAADPNLTVGLVDEHATRSAERSALRCHIGSGQRAVGQQPLGERGVEAAGDRVLDGLGTGSKNTRTPTATSSPSWPPTTPTFDGPTTPTGLGPTPPTSQLARHGPPPRDLTQRPGSDGVPEDSLNVLSPIPNAIFRRLRL